jgi:uncharacterized protein (TIGR02145 family)
LLFNGFTQVTDIDNHSYKAVVIGNQTWMAENLNTSKFRNGDLIPEAKTAEEWKKAGEEGKPAWCYYNNDTILGQKYGKLYNWYAAIDPRGVAPLGWHIPSYEEFNSLVHLSGDSLYSVNLKSNSGWDSLYIDGKIQNCTTCQNWSGKKRIKNICPNCSNSKTFKDPDIAINTNGIDLFNFNILPSGERIFNGDFLGEGEDCCLISTYETVCESCNNDAPKNQFISLIFTQQKMHTSFWKFPDALEKAGGYSIRCVED